VQLQLTNLTSVEASSPLRTELQVLPVAPSMETLMLGEMIGKMLVCFKSLRNERHLLLSQQHRAGIIRLDCSPRSNGYAVAFDAVSETDEGFVGF
jgi:hypothetical protein